MVRILFDYNECLKKGLIRKTVSSKDKAKKSLEASNQWLAEAEKNFASNALRSSLLSAYLAVFHASRSILFLDGYREKSHACIARYLEEKYVKKALLESKWVEMLDHIREIRHSEQYSFSFIASSGEVEETIKKSREFVNRMRRLIEEKI